MVHLVRLFYRELRRQRKQMTLTIVALAWGPFSIVILLAFGEGLNRQMAKAFHGLGQGICIVGGGQTSKPYLGLGRGRRNFLKLEDTNPLRQHAAGVQTAARRDN